MGDPRLFPALHDRAAGPHGQMGAKEACRVRVHRKAILEAVNRNRAALLREWEANVTAREDAGDE